MTGDRPPTVKRRWVTIVAAAVAGVVLLCVAASFGFRIWLRASLPRDAPRIAFSLDDTWLNRIGVTRGAYEQAVARAGGELVPIQPADFGDGPYDDRALADHLAAEGLCGVLLSGGGDVDPRLYGSDDDDTLLVNRRRDDFEIALIRAASRLGFPILGIAGGVRSSTWPAAAR